MKQGIIYGITFLFAFIVVTGMLIYLNSSYENIFKFNFSPKSILQLSDSTKTDSLDISEKTEIPQVSDTTVVLDSILLSSLGAAETGDTLKSEKLDSVNTKNIVDKLSPQNVKDKIESKYPKPEQDVTQTQENRPGTQNDVRGKEYTEWIQKVTSIYSAMEPKKAAKIIQTYSDNVARDILYSMNKKAAAKVVSEFNPETANRIFRFE